jgi:4-hydroxyphenylpyruvate dioxygenase
VFKPGYKPTYVRKNASSFFSSVDHIASEVRINESSFWTKYLTNSIGTKLVQSIQKSHDNTTGMILNISQSSNKNLTFVIAEPSDYLVKSKVQQNIETFGPGIHHLAFATDDLAGVVEELSVRGVDFVNISPAYYDLLRSNEEFNNIDIDTLQKNGILIDKEGDTFLLQKFIKTISDRPFFFYEIVQRVNGYNGFALKNINILKKAEEIEIIKNAAVLK